MRFTLALPAVFMMISDKVKFIGPVPNALARNIMRSSKIISLPSHMEAMPIAWLEAMSSGKPFIATSIGPSSECTDNGKYALLADPHSPDSLGNCLIDVCENYDFYLNMARESIGFVRSNFAERDVLKKNIELYKSFRI